MCSFTDGLVDGLDFLDNRLHQRAKQSLLIFKVVIKSSVGHMGVLADLPDAGPLKTIFQKVLLGAEQNFRGSAESLLTFAVPPSYTKITL